jgi:hypothetical protein
MGMAALARAPILEAAAVGGNPLEAVDPTEAIGF